MGIPGFASRIRCHGSTVVIGREGESRNDHAIIDGPSLAHALLQQCSDTVLKNDGGIFPQYSYAAIGKAAVTWLDDLQAHGFVVEAIYFDGALPDHKRKIRIARLQAYVDKLVGFKAVQDDITRAARNSRSGVSPEHVEGRMDVARKSLPPPPFLVFAVVEALRESAYAGRTFVVDGEADEFCAAKAFDVSQRTSDAQISIFSNDSDLVIYGLSDRVRVVQINEMSHAQNDDKPVLQSLEFWPHQLRGVHERRLMPDLVRSAYLMRLDPHLSFRNAVTKAQHDDLAFVTGDFEAFAAAYDLTTARAHLSASEEGTAPGEKHFQFLDSRLSEILRQAVKERDRVRQARAWHAAADSRIMEQMKADLARKRHDRSGAGDNGPPSATKCSNTVNAESIDRVDTRDFAYDPEEEDTKPCEPDLFLPVLFEDTTRATPWKAGTLLREVAMHVATSLCGAPVVFEYKRSGHRIRGAACQQLAHELGEQRLNQSTTDWRSELHTLSPLEDVWRWRFLVMKLLLADMVREEMTLPTRDSVMSVLQNSTASTWDWVHLNAQYQAMYYSLRMLKQVLDFVTQFERDEASSRKYLDEAAHLLKTLPSISAFCDAKWDEERERPERENAVHRLLRENALPESAKATKALTRGEKDGRKKRRMAYQTQNAFSALEEDAEGG